jgi:hypothetical protein
LTIGFIANSLFGQQKDIKTQEKSTTTVVAGKNNLPQEPNPLT